MNILLLLAAIAQIESRNNDHAIGRLGEISRYQIRPHIWHLFTTSKRYSDPEISQLVATILIVYIIRSLPRDHRTMQDILVTYNWGIGHYSKVHFNYNKVPTNVKQYVNKVLKQYGSGSDKAPLQPRIVSSIRVHNTGNSHQTSKKTGVLAATIKRNSKSTTTRCNEVIRSKRLAKYH